MKIIQAWTVEGVDIPSPYQRTIKVLLSPDKDGIQEYSVSQAIIFPKSKTDNHTHDRKELIYVVSGRGYCISSGDRIELEPDVLLLVDNGEEHQIFNESDETMKILVIFVPPHNSEYLKTRPLKKTQ